MNKLDTHPTVLKVQALPLPTVVSSIDAETLRKICLECGADDVGFVNLNRTEMDSERSDILRLFPQTRSVICLVCRMNPDAIRSPARNLANHEFHGTGDHVNDVARKIVAELAGRGVRSVNPPMAFPMEADKFPGKMWAISLKPLAVAAGMGQLGIHRNIIHPTFGNFILLGAVLVDALVDGENQPIEYNPCLGCKLCVAACPVGAISPEGDFNFSSCYAHNYREFMSGFTDWVEAIADSRSATELRDRVTDAESVSMWQSLAYGPNYKAAYCLSVCPAGEEVLQPFLLDRGQFLNTTLRPLQQKVETLYVQPNSDAEEYAKKRFPHKPTRRIGAVLRPASIEGFVKLMKHGFQPGKAGNLVARYHFRFTGSRPVECTVQIANGKIEVLEGRHGKCDLRVTSSAEAWLRLLRKEASVYWLLATLQIRLRGNPRLFARFGQCFP